MSKRTCRIYISVLLLVPIRICTCIRLCIRMRITIVCTYVYLCMLCVVYICVCMFVYVCVCLRSRIFLGLILFPPFILLMSRMSHPDSTDVTRRQTRLDGPVSASRCRLVIVISTLICGSVQNIWRQAAAFQKLAILIFSFDYELELILRIKLRSFDIARSRCFYFLIYLARDTCTNRTFRDILERYKSFDIVIFI